LKDISGRQPSGFLNCLANDALRRKRGHPKANCAGIAIKEGVLNHPISNKKIQVDLITAN